MFTCYRWLIPALVLCALSAGTVVAQPGTPEAIATAPSSLAPSTPDASAPEPATAEPPASAASAKTGETQANPIEQLIPEREKITLQAAGRSFPGYFKAASETPVKGAVLLLADSGHHPASEGLINTLRSTLADHHWHTLALDSGALDPTTCQQLIAAAIQYVNQQGFVTLAMLAEGHSAGLALQAAAGLPNIKPVKKTATPNAITFIKPVQALILLNGKTLGEDGLDLLDDFTETGITLVDAFSLGDFEQQRRADRRQQNAHRQQLNYLQLRLPFVDMSQLDEANRVSQRLRGWLDKHMNSALNPVPSNVQAAN